MTSKNNLTFDFKPDELGRFLEPFIDTAESERGAVGEMLLN